MTGPPGVLMWICAGPLCAAIADATMACGARATGTLAVVDCGQGPRDRSAAWAGDDMPKAINESAMPTMSVPRPTREAAFR